MRPVFRRGEVSQTVLRENDLILCEPTDTNIFEFHHYQLPEGETGLVFEAGLIDAQFIEDMKEAYFQWLAQEP